MRDRRARHRQRPLVVRVLTALGGFVLALAGLIVLVPLPEVGLPLLALALGLLALEFHWAAWALAWMLDRLAGYRAWLARRRPVVRGLLALTATAIVGAVILWIVTTVRVA